MTRPSRTISALLFSAALSICLAPVAQTQPAQASTAADSPAESNADQVAPGRENLEPAEPGFDDNTVDNQTGANWHPTINPKDEITPGQMRSDKEEIPGGFTKEQANQAEIQEAEEQASQTRSGIQTFAAVNTCRTYWPSPFKVCGKIREKYDSLGGPRSFLTWPKSDELTVPDGAGRRSEFVNGFIYWHPNTGAHPITTHFSIVWARTGWERGPLGYPTTDEFGLSDGIGRKQSFEHGHIYGSLAGLASIHGAISDKWIQTGAEKGPLGYPVTDETKTPDGIGRFNRFTGGMIYWHPKHGAHSIRGSILEKWANQGYEKGAVGYPIEDPKDDDGFKIAQKFQRGNLHGYESPIPELSEILGLQENQIDDLYTQLSEDFKAHQIPLRDGFQESYRRAKESLDFTTFQYNPAQNQIDTYALNDASTPAIGCDKAEFVPPGNERTNRGDVFYSKAVRAGIINHGHNGIFVSQGNADPRKISTVEAVGAERGVQLLRGSERHGVCQPTYLSVNTDNSTRDRAASWAESKVGKGYESNFATTRIGNIDRDSYNCSQLVWAAYKHASGGGLDIGERFAYEPYQPAVYPLDILRSHNTTAFN